MKILLVNKYYHRRAGAETYFLSLKALLESRGHEAAVFAMRHPLNLPARYESEFAPFVDYRKAGLFGRIRAAMDVIWSTRAARQIGRVLDRFRPDLVHLHNVYHQLSPSILPPITRRSIPIVHTLHDYKLICPNYKLRTGGQTCERCRGGRYHQAIKHRCLHGSLAWSALAALEMTLHKRWRIYENHVDRFVAPSVFLLELCVRFGVPREKLRHLPPFVPLQPQSPTPPAPGRPVAFVGRLAEEKGVLTLLEAVRRYPVPLVVAGDGPLRSRLSAFIEAHRLRDVRLTGFLQGEDLSRVVANSLFTVIPSEWYENAPLVFLESFSSGRAVVSTRLGGIPELVEHGQDGLLVSPSRPDDLGTAMEWLWKRPELAAQMGRRGWNKIAKCHDPATHYEGLRAIYEEARDGRD